MLDPVLNTLIPNYADELAYLKEQGPSGFIMGFGVTWHGPEFFVSTYPEAWMEEYQRGRYYVADPAFVRAIREECGERWSEIKLPDILNVYGKAKRYGLNYGALFTKRTGFRISFLSIARPDREFEDDEMEELHARFAGWAERVMTRIALTRGEIDVLRCFKDGDERRDVSRKLAITERAVTKRVQSACRKLGAKTKTQAVAIAQQRQYFGFSGVDFDKARARMKSDAILSES